MKTTVNILASVPRPEALAAALLVFKTLRTGFPTLPVNVFGNGLVGEPMKAVAAAAQTVGANYVHLVSSSHDEWIEQLLLRAQGPLWICDTDMVFFGSIEDLQTSSAMFAGRFEPEFFEPWTRTVHVERLHTCLMYMDAPRLRAAMRGWQGQFPNAGLFSNVDMSLVRQRFVPRRGQASLFYDTCAGLFHAIGSGLCGLGVSMFTPEENAGFEHLHCGSYAQEIAQVCPELKDLPKVHEAIFARPELARGLFQKQMEWYQQMSTARHARSVLPTRSVKKGRKCRTTRA